MLPGVVARPLAVGKWGEQRVLISGPGGEAGFMHI